MATDPYVGTIMLFAGTYAPQGWAQCNGQLLSISENDALFSLIGTTYGGDGKTTFALPDLRSRVPIHQGQGPGLGGYIMGQYGGAERVTLQTSQLPVHNHAAMGNSSAGTSTDPAAGVWASGPTRYVGQEGMAAITYIDGSEANTTMSPTSISNSGGGQPHDNMLPFQALNFCIALFGIYPSRS